MTEFFKGARNSRRNAKPFTSHPKDSAYIPMQTRLLQFLYKNYRMKPELFAGTPAFDHGKVTLRPLTCPAFKYESRCIRCQFLFHFCIEAEFQSIEIGNRSRGDGHVNAEFNCAETYAHFYCKEIFGSGELDSPKHSNVGWLSQHGLG